MEALDGRGALFQQRHQPRLGEVGRRWVPVARVRCRMGVRDGIRTGGHNICGENCGCGQVGHFALLQGHNVTTHQPRSSSINRQRKLNN